MERKVKVGTICFLCLSVALVLTNVQPAQAHDPKPVLRSIYAAPLAVITLYQVKPGSQEDFVNAMVSSGPYNRVLYGFANERILQAVSTSKTDSFLFISFARYYDKATADFVDAQRNPVITSFLQKDPVRVSATLLEHEIADWGWEKGTEQVVRNVRAMDSEDIFQRSGSSLSFFKAGYTGQLGMLEVLPSTSRIEDVRATLNSRRGLSGASIFSSPFGLVIYSEYFKSPVGASTRMLNVSTSGLSGAQTFMVVQNYVAR